MLYRASIRKRNALWHPCGWLRIHAEDAFRRNAAAYIFSRQRWTPLAPLLDFVAYPMLAVKKMAKRLARQMIA